MIQKIRPGINTRKSEINENVLAEQSQKNYNILSKGFL